MEDKNIENDSDPKENAEPLLEQVKELVFGKARNPTEPGVFHKLSLVAFLAWVGLGADGISSACYGPAETFLSMRGHYYLALILAVMTAMTVFIISTSYMQIIELFPTGGGGYLVASKLLSPTVGAVSGCALLVDYVLTITVSVASGADAIFSFLPPQWLAYKLLAGYAVLIVLIILNLRGIKESVIPIVPVFLLFIATHTFVILYAFFTHLGTLPSVVHGTVRDFHFSVSQMGFPAVMLLLLHAYSLGGGTYTGIEAVSNGLPILREPRVETGKRTMFYMAFSLALTAGGLILAFLLYNVEPQAGKTLNAVLFERISASWGPGSIFIMITLISEAFILLVAAQTGFLDGPRVLSNMALDGWMPNRFALLSERLVTDNGILLMGIASMILMWVSKGSVAFLVVLYSINVFLTFSLSQLGMVKHWWEVRAQESQWFKNLTINGIGFLLTSFLLVSITMIKFYEGGWLTIVITTSIVAVSILIKNHYKATRQTLQRLDSLLTQSVPAPNHSTAVPPNGPSSPQQLKENTAIILVNGFGGMGLHTLFTVLRTFKGQFKNFIFLQTGLIDAGRFKGVQEIENLKEAVSKDLYRYVDFMHSNGLYAESFFSLGTDVVDEIEKLAVSAVQRFPNSVLFSAQLVFPNETVFTRFLHNNTAFAIQKRLYYHGLPLLILPIRM